MPDTAAIRAQLQARLDHLTGRVTRVKEELRAPVSPSFSEQAIERETEEVLEDLGEVAQAEIAAIRAALARIEAGTYGECASCGKQIAPARLTAIPHTPLCIDCARQQD